MSLFPKNNYIQLTETGSTNEYLEQLAKEKDLPEGIVVISDIQSKGKGLDKNIWESEAHKNLTFSIYIRPSNILPTDQFLISICTSLAVYDTIHALTNKQVKIKWPNDIYIEDKKICGILIRHSIEGSSIGSSIIGIGINVNQTKFSSWIPNPTSIKLITEKNLSQKEILEQVLTNFENRYLQLLNDDTNNLYNEYLLKLYRKNQYYNYKINGKLTTAKITGIGVFGFLLLKDQNDVTYECDLKEVEYVL